MGRRGPRFATNRGKTLPASEYEDANLVFINVYALAFRLSNRNGREAVFCCQDKN
jgi:hypothetical protein